MRDLRIAWLFLVLMVACGHDEQRNGNPNETNETVAFDTADSTEPNDTAEDTTPLDTVPADTTPPEDGDFGASCRTNADCLDEWCVEGPEGFVCTRECSEQCPEGYDCKGVANQTDIVFLCIPRLLKQCTPCLDDLQCNGGVCLTIDGQRGCAAPCDDDAPCSDGFQCDADPSGTADGTFCVPETGSCSCNADIDGGLRTCSITGSEGTCFGVESCAPLSGWGACSVAPPTDEVCDGLDNDCDGLVDEALDTGSSCEVTVAGVGSCMGTQRCQGAAGLACQGPTPTEETCDFIDNDCDGDIDEDFKTGEEYTSFAHCGTCNTSCGTGFVGAQLTQCQVGAGVPQCVVVVCEPGFIKLNDFQCIPEVVNLCQPCSSDANCIGQDAACVTLDDGNFCGAGCASNTDCPDGFVCDDVGKPTMQCVPSTGVCSCGPGTLGLARPCGVTVSPDGQPSYTCAGTETCGAAGWGTCALPGELCDGFDNNCDGTIDEDFKDAQGRYNQVDNCGGCNISCLALSFENASPVCNTGGGGAPQCDFACDGDFQDIDGLPGCECLATSASDLPDIDGVDANCDRVDGEVDNAIFVAKTGTDGAPGTLAAPVRTIQVGIDRAVGSKRDVYVATGVYVESVTLKNGVNVYGGYSPDFFDRDTNVHETAIVGATPSTAQRGAVNATGVGTSASNALRLDGFTIFGANNSAAGGSSYAVYLRSVGAHVTIARNLIIAGDGGNGTVGTDGADGQVGLGGGAGAGARDVGTTCASSEHRAGGTRGSKTCGGVATHGGKGGNAICPDAPAQVQTASQTPAAQEYGVAGMNNSGAFGARGTPGWDSLVGFSSCGICSGSRDRGGNGEDGQDGRIGAAGGAPTQCTAAAGRIVSGVWRTNAAGSGGGGNPGGGGGGGAAGGGVDHSNGCASVPLVVGGAGGGGGAGGCGGGGGGRGGGAGGSFGIFIVTPAAIPSVVDNNVFRSRGGAGGAGGSGGIGGSGGFGAAGGADGTGSGNFPIVFCGNKGGAGGNAGRGGHGAGGAGGCGGVSYAIYLDPAGLGLPRAAIRGNTFPVSGAGGGGGAGGRSVGTDGGNGATGTSSAQSF